MDDVKLILLKRITLNQGKQQLGRSACVEMCVWCEQECYDSRRFTHHFNCDKNLNRLTALLKTQLSAMVLTSTVRSRAWIFGSVSTSSSSRTLDSDTETLRRWEFPILCVSAITTHLTESVKTNKKNKRSAIPSPRLFCIITHSDTSECTFILLQSTTTNLHIFFPSSPFLPGQNWMFH